jgi:predicted permease
MSELFRRIRYLIFRRRLEAELANDMEFHREMAERAGRHNFGNELRMREQAREAWGWTWLDRLGQDLRYAGRMLGRTPGFTLMAVLVLAIGIGVNVSAFSLFNLVALKPLPVRDPEAIVRLERRSPDAYTSEMAYPSFLFYSEHAKTLAGAVAVLGVPPMQIDEDLEGAKTSFVTPNYFTELGTPAALGRLFDPSGEAASDAAPVVVVSYGFWQRRFGADPSVIGRTIHLSKKPVTLIGVTPYAFASLGGQHPDLWLPMAQQPYFVDGSHLLTDFNSPSVRMWGRLAPGVTAKAAEQELKALTGELRREHPDAVWDGEYIQSSPGGHLQVMQPEMYRVAAMVSVLTLLILAVACANLGALLLARAVTREHEIGIRVAIGAGRARIFRQLCTESLLLAMLGAAAGLGLGCVVLRVMLNVTDAPKWLSATPDCRVLLFTLATTLMAAIFFGLAPALQIARQRQHKTLARQILIGAQVAASSVLLIVAGLLVRATQHALYTDPGFGYEQLLSIDPQLGQHGYAPAAAREYLNQLQSRLIAVAGVRSVSLVKLPPMGHVVSYQDAEIDGRRLRVYPNWVEPGFFATMEIPILSGRTFYSGEQNAMIVSASFARQQWPGQNPLGQRVGDGKHKDVVVGVTGDAHVNALSEDDAVEQYWPAQQDDMPGMVVMIRTAGSGDPVAVAARSICESLNPALFPEIRQLKLLYKDNVSIIERVAAAVSLTGMVAVLLAGVGLVGLVGFSVSQRTKEIAIRMALGARRARVLSTVLRQFAWPVGVGLLAGTAAAAGLSKLLRFALYGVSNFDPAGYAGAIGVLLAIVAVAAFLPARRVMRLDIAKALHRE